MRNLLVSLILVFISFSNATQAQPKKQFVKSGEIIKAAYHFCDSNWYTKAIDTLKTIDKSDTAYALALTELAYCYLQTKEYSKAIQFANNAIGYASASKQRLAYINGNSYDGWGYPDSAISIYKESLKKFPYSYLTYFNLGVTYTNQKKYNDAVKAFQQAIIYNPFHSSSYICLGRLMGRMGQYTHAMLCLETYLLIDPNGTRSNYNLVFINNMVSNGLGDDFPPIPSTVDNKAFEETDQLIKSGIALNSGYKVKVKFSAPVAKQTQLLFESLHFKANTGDFWMDLFVPMLLKVKEAGFEEDFIYNITASAPNKDIANQIKKRQKNIKEMNSMLGAHLITFYKKQKITINGIEQTIDLHLFDNHNIASYGNFENDHKTKTGPWKFFHANGQPKSEGNYVDGKLDGKWFNYNENGTLISVETYSKGQMNGEYVGYYESGNPKFKSSYVNNLVEDDVTYYYDCDAVSSIKHFENGKKNGKKTVFYKNGAISEEAYFLKDSMDGDWKTYYPNGVLKSQYKYKDNKIQGTGTDYYRNGKPSYIGEYSNSIRDGKYTTYFQNGVNQHLGYFKHGKRIGEWKEFNDKGGLTELCFYNDKGEITKESKRWGDDGKLYNIFTYDNGVLKEIKYFDKTGKIIANSKLNKNTTPVIGYYADGNQMYKGFYTNGKIDGTWTYYYKCGKKHFIKNFKNGASTGLYTNFYTSGQKQMEFNYTNGEEDGYFTKFYPNGQISKEGWFVEGNKEGKWYEWNPDGTLEKTIDHLKNELNGDIIEYAPDKKIQYTDGYKNSINTSFTDFDTLGNVVNHTILNGKNDYCVYYPDGKIRGKGEYKCNQFNSKYPFFDRKGSIVAEYQYENGDKNGHYTKYYSPGKMEMEGSYESDNQTGIWKYFDEDGLLTKKGKFLNNQKDSLWTAYHTTGKIKYEIWYKNGDLIDTAKYFDSFGEFMYSIVYDEFGIVSYQYYNDHSIVSKNISPKDTGTIITYYKNGKISSNQEFKYGSLEGKKLLYYSNGNPYKELFLADDLLNGKSIEYYENGKPKIVEYYLMGQNHGTSQFFRPDGTLEHSVEFKCDQKHGNFIKFDAKGKQIKANRYWGNVLLN